jgi:hypothetical protein
MQIDPILSVLIPLAVFFIIPQFIYSGISVGVLPVLLYFLTFQYHLSGVANFFLPSPYLTSVSAETALISLTLIICSVIGSYISGLFLIRYFEYY